MVLIAIPSDQAVDLPPVRDGCPSVSGRELHGASSNLLSRDQIPS